MTTLGNQLRNSESQLKALIYKFDKDFAGKVDDFHDALGKYQDGSSGEMEGLAAVVKKLQGNQTALNKKYDDIINQLNYQVLENQNKMFREYDS